MRRSWAIAATWCATLFWVAGCSAPDGSPCRSNGECGWNSSCVYKIADGCASVRTCQPIPTGARCNVIAAYCGCDGTQVEVGCDQPNGYAPAPVSGPTTGPCQSVDGGGQD